jgi:hypothetical protein
MLATVAAACCVAVAVYAGTPPVLLFPLNALLFVLNVTSLWLVSTRERPYRNSTGFTNLIRVTVRLILCLSTFTSMGSLALLFVPHGTTFYIGEIRVSVLLNWIEQISELGLTIALMLHFYNMARRIKARALRVQLAIFLVCFFVVLISGVMIAGFAVGLAFGGSWAGSLALTTALIVLGIVIALGVIWYLAILIQFLIKMRGLAPGSAAAV